MPEDVDGEQWLQRVDRLGRLDAAVHRPVHLDVVLVVTTQHDDVIRCGDEELERRAQHAGEAEAAAIDVVAEEHEEGIWNALRILPPRVDPLEEAALESGRLQDAVATVKVAEDGELRARAGLRHPNVGVAVEELTWLELGERL